MSPPDPSNIARIAAILASFDASNAPRQTGEILSNLSIARSTGFGLLRALADAGWMERVDHARWRLGPRARGLVFAPLEAPNRTSLRKMAAAPRSDVDPRPGARQSPDLLGSDLTSPELEWDPALVRIVDARRFQRTRPYRIGFSNASTSNAWRRAMLESLDYGHRLAASSLSALLVRDARDDPALQLAQIDELVAEGIDLLLISITSVTDTRLSDRLGALAARGLPIVAVDRRPNDRGSLVSFVTASDHRIGRISALWMAEHLEGHGRVWMLSGLAGASPALRRQQAALAVFSEFPGITVETVSHTDWTARGGALAVARAMSDVGQPPDGVWCDSGLQGVGSVRWFLDRGTPVPAHTGGDLNEMYKLCLHHRVPMAALDYPASMGARALETALDVLRGGQVPQRVEVPVQIVLPRGQETASVKADTWAERHVAWDLGGDAILSQGPSLRTARGAPSETAGAAP